LYLILYGKGQKHKLFYRLAKYTNYCYKAKNKKPESALNTALSGKIKFFC
jgi:hypothetical protein